MNPLARAACGVLASLGVCVGAHAQDGAISVPEGDYTQTATGMTYPASIGDFRRVSVVRSGKDELARYEHAVAGSETAVTVRVYKGPGLLLVGGQPPAVVLEALHKGICLKGADAEMNALAADSVSAGPSDTSLRRGLFGHNDGYKVEYALTMPEYFGRKNEPVASALYRFCFVGDNNWTIEYRFDHPRNADTSGDIATFMKDLDWTFR